MHPTQFGKRLYKVINLAVVGLVGGMALLLALVTVPGIVGFNPVVVLSGSMEPALSVGDVAVIRSVDTSGLRVGDIITYRSGGGLVTHRIVEVERTESGRLFHVKGDANNAEDGIPIIETNVVAKVVYSVPQLGFLVTFADSPNGMMLLIVGPAVLLLILWAHDWNRKRSRARQLAPAVAVQQGQEG